MRKGNFKLIKNDLCEIIKNSLKCGNIHIRRADGRKIPLDSEECVKCNNFNFSCLTTIYQTKTRIGLFLPLNLLQMPFVVCSLWGGLKPSLFESLC